MAAVLRSVVVEAVHVAPWTTTPSEAGVTVRVHAPTLRLPLPHLPERPATPSSELIVDMGSDEHHIAGSGSPSPSATGA